jgi:arginyl-tRNA synthetase
VVSSAVHDLLPCKVCSYVYALASRATDFVEACRVMGSASPVLESRLLLIEGTGLVMRQCLTLLGITPLFRI